jgi:hypothetical protein
MEVVARYNFTYRDLYKDHDVDDKDQSLQDYENEEERFHDYRAFKAENPRLITNTKYYIIDTSYTRRLFGWYRHEGKHENYESIIALEARHDTGYYDGPEDREFCYASGEEGQYLLDNLSEQIDLANDETIRLSGWFGFKAKKNFEIPECVDILADIGFCGFLSLYPSMDIIWFRLPNGQIVAYCTLDTESG